MTPRRYTNRRQCARAVDLKRVLLAAALRSRRARLRAHRVAVMDRETHVQMPAHARAAGMREILEVSGDFKRVTRPPRRSAVMRRERRTHARAQIERACRPVHGSGLRGTVRARLRSVTPLRCDTTRPYGTSRGYKHDERCIVGGKSSGAFRF